jgi:hypothetical protein
MTNQVSISTYHEYILEGISALRQGLQIVKFSQETSDILEMQDVIFGEIYCRYGFLMIANSLEAAGNALVFSVHDDKAFYEEAEKLNTLFKFQLFCRSFGGLIPQGNHHYSRIKELISCRNEFVHPKPRKVDYNFDPDSPVINYDIKENQNKRVSSLFC